MNWPQVHMCPLPSWTPLPSPSPPYPSGLSQSTNFGCPASHIKLALAICFIYSNVWSNRSWQFDLWFLCVFYKSSLYIWKFSVHVLLKPSLKDFEDYLASVWDECNCAVVWAFWGIAFLWDGMKTDLFQSCGHCWVFQICWRIECSTFTALSFSTWNSSAWIPLPPLTLFIVMLPEFHLTSHSRMSGSRWVITASCLSGSLRPFLCSSSVYVASS